MLSFSVGFSSLQVRGALETLLHALTTEERMYKEADQVQPGLVNSELLAREPDSIALVLSLLDETDFYVRYHTLQLLTALLTNCPARLQDVIVATPQGIPRLMDMMLEREVCPMFTNAFSIYHFLNQGRSVCSKMLQSTKHFLIV